MSLACIIVDSLSIFPLKGVCVPDPFKSSEILFLLTLSSSCSISNLHYEEFGVGAAVSAEAIFSCYYEDHNDERIKFAYLKIARILGELI